MQRTQIMLTEDIKKRIRHKARKDRKSMGSVIRDAISSYVLSDAINSRDALLEMFENAITSKKDRLPQMNSGNLRKYTKQILKI